MISVAEAEILIRDMAEAKLKDARNEMERLVDEAITNAAKRGELDSIRAPIQSIALRHPDIASELVAEYRNRGWQIVVDDNIPVLSRPKS